MVRNRVEKTLNVINVSGCFTIKESTEDSVNNFLFINCRLKRDLTNQHRAD